MPEENRWKFLVPWVTTCISDNPEILDSKTPATVYQKLYNIWIVEVQTAMKEAIRKAQ